MRTHRFAVVLGLAVATSAVVVPAAAAPGDSSSPPAGVPEASAAAIAEAGRTSFNQGLRSYAKKRYNQALASFLQAYALTKNPAVLINLGQTMMRLGSPLNAVRYFQKYLDDMKSPPPELKARVEQSLAEARAMLGAIDVSAPDGSEIHVDGETVGRAPLSAPIDVMPGKHEVTMTSSAGSNWQNIEVARGGHVALKLVPRVVSHPATAPPPSGVKEPEESASPGFFSPPSVIAPVYVFGAVGLVGLTTAIVLNGIRVNADRNATTSTQALVRNGKDPMTCSPNPPDATMKDACLTIEDSKKILKDTKDPFTAALWVGVGSTAVAFAWYFIAPKERNPLPKAGKLELVPMFGGHETGATLRGTF